MDNEKYPNFFGYDEFQSTEEDKKRCSKLREIEKKKEELKLKKEMENNTY